MTRDPSLEEKAVFGDDCLIDAKTNRPIEQGIGSKGHETLQHYESLERDLAREIGSWSSLGIEPHDADQIRARYVETRRQVSEMKGRVH